VNELGAELQRRRDRRIADREHAPADPFACLEDLDGEPGGRERPRGTQAGYPGADHGDVDGVRSRPSHFPYAGFSVEDSFRELSARNGVAGNSSTIST
jgi:hypothetical protein